MVQIQDKPGKELLQIVLPGRGKSIGPNKEARTINNCRELKQVSAADYRVQGKLVAEDEECQITQHSEC